MNINNKQTDTEKALIRHLKYMLNCKFIQQTMICAM